MLRLITASDRLALTRLASTLPVGSSERRILLSSLTSVARDFQTELRKDVLQKYKDAREEENAKPVVRGKGLTPKQKNLTYLNGEAIQRLAETFIELIPEFNALKARIDEAIKGKDRSFWNIYDEMSNFYSDKRITWMLQKSQGPRPELLFPMDQAMREELLRGLRFIQNSYTNAPEAYKRAKQTDEDRARSEQRSISMRNRWSE